MPTEIAPERLAAMEDAGEPVTLIDTRPADSYESYHIGGAKNVPYESDGEVDEDRIRSLIPEDDGRLVTVCAKGVSSFDFADELEDMGYGDVDIVEGGMEAWSQLYHVVPVPTPDADLELYQVQRRAKGCLGYVVGSRSERVAAVVDPTRNTGEFREAAAANDLEITCVLDTHVHADHISGGRTLADDLDVPYYLGERADERDVAYEFTPLTDGEILDVGGVQVTALYTPGHTSEMMSYRVDETAVLTGDTLFVDGVGRTELQFGEADAETGARLLYGSLHDVLLSLGDDVLVLPGHYTVTDDGEYVGGRPGEPFAAAVGGLRDDLDLLGLDEDAFVERIVERVPEKPPNYDTVIDINRGVSEPEDEQEATELELGPNRCAAG